MAVPSGFRIICDLSDFFHESDMRRKSFIFVDFSRYQTVNDLCKRIQSTFNIETSIALAVDGYFLPHAEDIRILCNADDVRVFKINYPGTIQYGIHVATSNRRKKKNKGVTSSDVRGIETEEANELAGDLGNETDVILQMGNGPTASVDKLSTDVENASPDCSNTTSVDEVRQKKKRRRKHSSQTEDKSTGDKENSVNETLITEPKCDTSNIHAESVLSQELMSIQCKDLDSVDVNECPVIPVNGSTDADSEATKKKRKRHRTRQRKPKVQKTFNDEHILNNENMNSTPGHNQQSYSNSYIQTSLESNLSVSKHVRFAHGNHTADINDFNNCEVNHNFRERLPMNGVQESSLQQRNGVSPHSAAIPPEMQVANLPNTGALNVEKQTAGVMSFDKILSLAHSSPIVVKREVPSKAIVVANPDVGATPVALNSVVKDDVLTFKIWKMDENYCPQISELITAKVLINATSIEQLTLEVLEGNDYCLQPRGKFDMTEEEDEESEQNYCRIINLQWQDIIEPHHKNY